MEAAMNKVFDLPLRRGGAGDRSAGVFDANGDLTGDFTTCYRDEAAAHAINCHDEMVGALKSAFTVMVALQKEQGLKPTEYAVAHEIKAVLAKVEV